jgi:hypothetical protein
MLSFNNFTRVAAVIIFTTCVLSLFNVVSNRISVYAALFLGLLISITWIRKRKRD